MTNLTRNAILVALAAMALSACSDQAEPQAAPIEEEIEDMAGEVPEVTPVDDALLPDTADASEDGSSAVESGSNDKGARQPDPKRTKLIKADPN
ncbi:MAG: hypothetical protein AAFO28_04370 [Pseudomonadota bacterium]